MKRKNMKVGMKVVVKPIAIGGAGSYKGEVVTLNHDGNYWLFDGCSVVLPHEVRKAAQYEILASMTTKELQRLLDDIDIELDKRLAAVHPDARYMFRECVVDGHTCYVMGFGDCGSKKSVGVLLIEGHPEGWCSGGTSFLGHWVGRKDLTWKNKRKVKLVNEDGSLEDVV